MKKIILLFVYLFSIAGSLAIYANTDSELKFKLQQQYQIIENLLERRESLENVLDEIPSVSELEREKNTIIGLLEKMKKEIDVDNDIRIDGSSDPW